MRRLLLPLAVLAAFALALVGAATAPAPARLPAIALGTVLVWRAEVAAILFASAYAAVVVLRLALHGETLTRVGRDSIEVPRVRSRHTAACSPDPDLADALTWLQTFVHASRGRHSTNTTDALLRRDQEDT